MTVYALVFMAAFRDCRSIPVVLLFQITSLYVTGEMWSSGHVFSPTLRPHVSEDSRVPGRWEIGASQTSEDGRQRLHPQSSGSQKNKKEKKKMSHSFCELYHWLHSTAAAPIATGFLGCRCYNIQWFKSQIWFWASERETCSQTHQTHQSQSGSGDVALKLWDFSLFHRVNVGGFYFPRLGLSYGGVADVWTLPLAICQEVQLSQRSRLSKWLFHCSCNLTWHKYGSVTSCCLCPGQFF